MGLPEGDLIPAMNSDSLICMMFNPRCARLCTAFLMWANLARCVSMPFSLPLARSSSVSSLHHFSPLAILACKASLVRCDMRSASYCANVANIPMDSVLNSGRSAATKSTLSSMSLNMNDTLRLSRSNFAMSRVAPCFLA